jgi:hypothetical protein
LEYIQNQALGNALNLKQGQATTFWEVKSATEFGKAPQWVASGATLEPNDHKPLTALG